MKITYRKILLDRLLYYTGVLLLTVNLVYPIESKQRELYDDAKKAAIGHDYVEAIKKAYAFYVLNKDLEKEYPVFFDKLLKSIDAWEDILEYQRKEPVQYIASSKDLKLVFEGKEIENLVRISDDKMEFDLSKLNEEQLKFMSLKTVEAISESSSPK